MVVVGEKGLETSRQNIFRSWDRGPGGALSPICHICLVIRWRGAGGSPCGGSEAVMIV